MRRSMVAGLALTTVVVILVSGEVRAAPQPACDELSVCLDFGNCSLTRDGRCASLTDDDCLVSRVCLEYGFCTATPNGCLPSATDVGDCDVPRGALLHSPCADDGRCGVLDGVCVDDSAHAADCESSCRREGACTLEGGRCVATEPAHCSGSEICRELGHCTLLGHVCAASRDADCAASELCTESGACRAIGGFCMARLDDCLRLPACFADDLGCTLDGVGKYGRCTWRFMEFEF